MDFQGIKHTYSSWQILPKLSLNFSIKELNFDNFFVTYIN
jgi:hypothetical protein